MGQMRLLTRRPDRPVACVVRVLLPALAALFLPAAQAGYHERGNISISIGGSIAHTSSYDRQYEDAYEPTEEEEAELTSASGDFTDMDFSLFLSLGYFVIDRLELGISGSTMLTWYPEGEESDTNIHDAQLYARYYFDNKTSFTPYVKAQGGVSYIDTGGYEETDAIGGVSAGLEFFGMGPMNWYVELSSQYTQFDGDLTGAEWRNQVYFGVSWYFDTGKDGDEDSTAAQPDPLAGLSPEVRAAVEEDYQKWENAVREADKQLEKEAAGN